MTRSVLAVTAGLLSLIILTYIATMIAFVLFISSNSSPSVTPAYLIISTVYILLFAITGGFITASVSIETPQRDIAILSVIVFLIWIVSSILQFGRQPILYSLLLLITLPVAILAGGRIKINRLKKEEDSHYI